MEELGIDNILDSTDIENLFSDSGQSKESSQEDEKINKNKEITTTEVNVDELFDDSSKEKPESVGSGNKESHQEDSSKNSSPFSSIADALKKDGILPDLSDEAIAKVKSAEDFGSVIEEVVQGRLDEKQKRIDMALNYNIEPSKIKNFEDTLSFLDSIEEKTLKLESEEGEKLRQNLIYQDYINKGYSKERAAREVKKSFDSGTDIEDALDALANNTDFFNSEYKKLITVEEEKIRKEKEIEKSQGIELKKVLLEDKVTIGKIEVNTHLRQKAYDIATKPIHKTENGELLTVLQKYQKENKVDFLKNVSLLYTLTDGFKNMDSLIKSGVNQETKKTLRELEHTLNNTLRNSEGGLNFIGGTDTNSYKGFELDV
jgi:hypothetical protein